ncbi:MAG: peptidase T [Clostridia bacterium]|nr:peptidase T [Clostridia bacterium]
MNVVERFLKLVETDSTSREGTDAVPSSEGQWAVAREAARQLTEIGMQDVRVDQNAYVYACLPANAQGDGIGLIAHIDTSDAAPGGPIRAEIRRYSGGDLTLAGGDVLSPSDYPFLNGLAGQDLIVTDGSTLLGADDKAGVAEIIAACAYLTAHPEIPHGKVAVCFTPDEEIGHGAALLDPAAFGVDYAYTVDGGALGEIECENFNAAAADVKIRGVAAHPGDAKDKMKNAALIAAQFACLLPESETPQHTEKREGFYHLTGIEGGGEAAALHYILRDHDAGKLAAKKDMMRRLADLINARYGDGTATVSIRDSYRNMFEIVRDHMDIVRRAERAFERIGVRSTMQPIRGGTDGAQLTFRGLICPNLSTGGYNFHSRREMIPVDALEKMACMLVELVRQDAENG